MTDQEIIGMKKNNFIWRERIEGYEADREKQIAKAQLQAHRAYYAVFNEEKTRLMFEGLDKEEAESQAAEYTENFWVEMQKIRDQVIAKAKELFTERMQTLQKIPF